MQIWVIHLVIFVVKVCMYLKEYGFLSMNIFSLFFYYKNLLLNHFIQGSLSTAINDDSFLYL